MESGLSFHIDAVECRLWRNLVYAMVWQGICGLALLDSIRHTFFIREAGYRRKASILPLHSGGNLRLVAHLGAFARSV